MKPHAATLRLDTLTIRAIGVESDTDIRSVAKEIREPGSVRGRPGERIRSALIRRGLARTLKLV